MLPAWARVCVARLVIMPAKVCFGAPPCDNAGTIGIGARLVTMPAKVLGAHLMMMPEQEELTGPPTHNAGAGAGLGAL